MRLTPFALVFLLIGLSSPVTSFTFPQYKLPALTEEIQNVLLKSTQRFQITKKHATNYTKKFRKLTGHTRACYSFECPANTITGNGNDANLLNLILINSWNHIKSRWSYFGRVLVIWNLCAAVVALMAVAANSCDCGAMVTSPMTMITMTVYFRYLILIEKMINNSKSLA